jgi:hypothetical protein
MNLLEEEALRRLAESTTSSFHLKMGITTGMIFFTNAYFEAHARSVAAVMIAVYPGGLRQYRAAGKLSQHPPGVPSTE